MKSTMGWVLAGTVAVTVMAASVSRGAPAQVDAGAVPNAVQAEMRVLLVAMQGAMAAVANNELQAIPPLIHGVHNARSATEKALHQGLVKLPRNNDKLEDFIKQDNAFHDELVKLVRASRANDLPATTRQLGVVMEGCTACHARYRF